MKEETLRKLDWLQTLVTEGREIVQMDLPMMPVSRELFLPCTGLQESTEQEGVRKEEEVEGEDGMDRREEVNKTNVDKDKSEDQHSEEVVLIDLISYQISHQNLKRLDDEKVVTNLKDFKTQNQPKMNKKNRLSILEKLKEYPCETIYKLNPRTKRNNKLLVCCYQGCGKTFNKTWNILDHFKIHTGERPYECKACMKSFTQNGNLTKHLKTKPECVDFIKSLSKSAANQPFPETHAAQLLNC
uniref:C2H2-type domain-containing protein n=1 Tax=Euplotes harpa TaxID=151035 RepID=A0A7S3J2Q3_9SPIT|mmetsp:Transcript_13486/g.15650  ORF Transcript_13486/g.15650 Transcript_13486/m.15650 type:complete len:243 (+) Transcript_13486:34-762(+)